MWQHVRDEDSRLASGQSGRDSQGLRLENCQARRGFCSKHAELLVDALENHSAIVRNLQGIRAPQPASRPPFECSPSFSPEIAKAGQVEFQSSR